MSQPVVPQSRSNVDYKSDRPFVSVVQQLTAQALARDSAAAILFGERQLSWRELERRANQLAHHLIASGVVAETRVGVGSVALTSRWRTWFEPSF